MDDKFLEAGFGALGGGGKRTPSKQKEGFERAILSAKVKSSTAGINQASCLVFHAWLSILRILDWIRLKVWLFSVTTRYSVTIRCGHHHLSPTQNCFFQLKMKP